MNSKELINFAETLEKVAEYIEELEAENESLEKAAQVASDTLAVQPERVETLEKLAEVGFTQEELEEINGLSDSLMKKMASVAEKPWGFGEAVGPAREKTDPLLEFMLG